MKKKIIIIGIVIVCLAFAGVGVYRAGVNFLFDRYIINTTLSSLVEQGAEEEPLQQETEEVVAEVPGEENPEDSQTDTEESAEQPEQSSNPGLSNEEVVARVMKSPELTNKMASMIPYEDKRRVLQIIMSNFTTDELAQIAKNVSKGMSPQYKSKMISEARSRLTPAQWQECLAIAYKYIDKIRPYVE